MKEIKLGRSGLVALVDNKDYERVSKFNWWAAHDGDRVYARTRIDGKLVYMHRFLLNITDQLEIYIDHHNGNGSDNRNCNMRRATNSENQCNSRKRSTNNNGRLSSSRFKGVSLHKPTGRWRVCVMFNSKRVYLGQFDNEEDAARSYNKFAIEHYGEFARLNVIDEPGELREPDRVEMVDTLDHCVGCV